MATLEGKTLGKYRVIERLGRGGMAEVYKGYHPRLDRYMAIKVLHGYLAEGEDFLGRFEREARAVATLRHPHIVQVFDFEVEDNAYYMVMEFIDGGTLKARMEELSVVGEQMPLAETARIFREVAGALDHAHREGMLHRDVKPSNILLDRSGRVFLTDFGLARMVSGSTQYTTTGMLVGTPAYMSPEQGQGLHVGVPTDIYALGVVLYELVVGRPPFDADTPLAIIYKHVHDPLPLPRTFRPSLPEALERVILKALAKEPQDRYQSAAKMMQALESTLAQQPEATFQPADPVELSGDETGPTESWLSEPLPDEAAQDTSALEQQPESVAASTSTTTTPEPPSELEEPTRRIDPIRQPVTVASSTGPERKEPRRQSPALPQRRSLKPLLIALAIAVPVGLCTIAAGLILMRERAQSVGVTCPSIMECGALAKEHLDRGDFEGTLAYADKGLELVPPDRHPRGALLWCSRGDANTELRRFGQARSDYEQCIAWTEGRVVLKRLRDHAEARLRALEGK